MKRFSAAGQHPLELDAKELARHQHLVTHEAEAVYLKDVRLNLPFPWPAKGLELGDCQGSDSPIPQHLAQVQNYLIGADLVIYVISSRVGLRQADYKFLTDLKRMRLLANCVFVLNLDLNELENLDEAQGSDPALAAGNGGLSNRGAVVYLFRPGPVAPPAQSPGADPQPQRPG